MNDLQTRLQHLGESLELDDERLVDDVLARLDGDHQASAPRRDGGATWLRAAAVAVVVAAAVLLAVPDSRRAIADWLGLRGVRIEQDPELTVPATAPAVRDAAPIGDAEVITVDGVEVMVSVIDGSFEPDLIKKTVAEGTDAFAVDVGGSPGVWIAGRPHLVVYERDGGSVATVRVAGNTLLWQDGDLIRRVEGFPTLDEALAFATR